MFPTITIYDLEWCSTKLNAPNITHTPNTSTFFLMAVKKLEG